MKEMFLSNKGQLSYKRVTGFIALITAIVFASLSFPTEIVFTFISYSATMGAGGLLEKDKKGLNRK